MAIGIVRGLIGKVTVTDAKGSVRELRVGDAVELNVNVQASAAEPFTLCLITAILRQSAVMTR